MFKIFAFAAALAAVLAAPAVQAQSASSPEPIRVMIVGAFHFDNPGQDLHNVRVDPVTSPSKQAELARVAESLARFAPTAVAVERVATDRTTLRDHRWPDFTPAQLLTHPDERVQIGYRLAGLTGLDRVYAIDEQSRERDYFPYGPLMTWAETNGRAETLRAMNAPIAAHTADLEARQRTETLGALLAHINRRDHPIAGDGARALHYGLLALGDGEAQPGAALNAGWYERNARIFAKLAHVTRPGDRIVVVFGAGHNDWLRHFVESTPGFELVDPVPYLAAAD